MAKTSQHLALQHTRAVTLADAIIERIRVNPSAVAVYNIGTDSPAGAASSSEPSPDCRTAACSPAQLAAHDLWTWEQSLLGAGAQVAGENTAGLIAPRGCIVFTPAPERTRTGQLGVIIQWRGLQESYDAVQDGEVVCGSDAAAAGTDRYRRQVVTNTYVVDEEEF
jgi:type IV pilus assembly protein PilV